MFDTDKLVLTCNGDFVGKGYCHGGLFVLDANFDGMNNIGISSTYIVESLDLWHAILGHVNVASIKRMKQLNLIEILITLNFQSVKFVLKQNTRKNLSNPLKEILDY